MRLWHRIRHQTRGSQIAEAAVIMPLMIMMLLGITWFGRAFNLYATINRAAQEGAKAAAAPTCATCSNTFYNAATLQTTVINPILNAAHLDPNQVKGYTLQTGVQLNPGQTPPEIGTIVTLSYPYGFRLNGLSCCPLAIVPINTGITITARAQAREED